MGLEKHLNVETFKNLVNDGLNCKQIAEKMGIHSHTFGLKIKKLIGVYPSVYIHKVKNGKN